MKVLNIYAAALAAFTGAGGLLVGFSDKDSTAIGLGVGLLVSALIFGTLSAGLALLEAIRDDLRTAARGIQKDIRYGIS